MTPEHMETVGARNPKLGFGARPHGIERKLVHPNYCIRRKGLNYHQTSLRTQSLFYYSPIPVSYAWLRTR